MACARAAQQGSNPKVTEQAQHGAQWHRAPGTGHRALPGTGRGQPRVGKGTFTPWHNPGPALPKKQPWEQVFRDGSPVLAALVLQKLQGEPEFSNT